MLKDIFLSIQTQLKEQVPTIRYIDEDWGQMDAFDPKPVQYPCAIISLNNVQWGNAGKHYQEGLLSISISVYTQKLTRTSAQAPDTQKHQGLSIHSILQEMHLAIHAFQPTPFTTTLIRTSTSRIPTTDGISGYTVTYTCQVYEEFKQPTTAIITDLEMDDPTMI